MREHTSLAGRHRMIHSQFLQALLIKICCLIVALAYVMAAVSRAAGNPVKDWPGSYLHLATLSSNTLYQLAGTSCAQICADKHNALLNSPDIDLDIEVKYKY